jgi:hypothetical protein
MKMASKILQHGLSIQKYRKKVSYHLIKNTLTFWGSILAFQKNRAQKSSPKLQNSS